jgi:hypothetical protein
MKAVKGRHHPLAKLMLAGIVSLFCSSSALTQTSLPRPSPTPHPRPVDGTARGSDDRPLTTFEEEIRAKHAIKLAEKDHQENLARAREIEQLGRELQETLRSKSNIDRAAFKKIERLEKLAKKVRGEAGGEDDEVSIDNRPSDIASALKQIAKASESLSKNVQNTPRQVVSASVIGDANVLLELLKELRSLTRQP